MSMKVNDETSGRRIVPNLWFDHNAEEAVNFYVSIFDDSKIGKVSRYGSTGYEIHGMEAGTIMTIEFTLDGHRFTALNGGPHFQFNEAISLIVNCDSQEEIDYYWTHLSEGGDGRAQQCGWLKDKYGVSWQVVPSALSDMVNEDGTMSEPVFDAMLQMKKLDIDDLRAAYDGQSVRGSGS